MTAMTSSLGPSGARDDVAPRSPLPPGFYHLTLVAVFLTTSELRPPRLGGLPAFTVLEILLYPAAMCLAAEALARPNLVAHLGALYRRNRVLCWYVGYGALAAVIGLSRTTETLQTYKDLAVGVVLYALVFLTVDSPARLGGVFLANLSGSMLSVTLALSQIATGGPYLVDRVEAAEAKMDLTGDAVGDVPMGIFAHPNGFTIALMPTILFLLVAVWPGFGRLRRAGWPALVPLMATLFVVGLAYVKGVYAWLFAGAAVIFLPRRFDRWRLHLSVGLVLGGVAALTWVGISAYLEGEGLFGTIVSRVELWLAAIDTIGSDGYVAVLGSGDPAFQERTFVTVEYGNAHNAWLNQALTYGIPAMVLYLGAFWTALRSLARTVATAGHPHRGLALATMASLTALVGEYFFEPVDRGVIYQAQLFVLFALASICRRFSTPTTPWEARST